MRRLTFIILLVLCLAVSAQAETRSFTLFSADLPQGWDGDEPTADTVMETVYQNGAVQPLLFGEEFVA